MMRRQGGHPAATGSNRFKRYATGHFHGPHCCVKTPFPIPCFSSTNSVNGLFGLGRARAGASSRARLSVWKACFIVSVQVQFGVSLLPSYKGRAFSANPMIHSLQYPTVPRNSLTWRGVMGSGICNIVSFMAWVSHLCPCLILYPKYVTSCRAICAFFALAQYPKVPRVCKMSLVARLHASSVAPANIRSSTYCSRMTSGWRVQHSWRSSLKASLNKVGERVLEPL